MAIWLGIVSGIVMCVLVCLLFRGFLTNLSLASALIEEHQAESRKWWELHAAWALERVKLIEDAREERRQLAGMIVGYNPNVFAQEPKPPPAGSQREGTVAEEPIWNYDELAESNIRENTGEGGGWIDMATGAVFETPDDIQEWRASLRKKGLPPNLHPTIVREAGIEMAVESARKENGPQKGARP